MNAVIKNQTVSPQALKRLIRVEFTGRTGFLLLFQTCLFGVLGAYLLLNDTLMGLGVNTAFLMASLAGLFSLVNTTFQIVTPWHMPGSSGMCRTTEFFLTRPVNRLELFRARSIQLYLTTLAPLLLLLALVQTEPRLELKFIHFPIFGSSFSADDFQGAFGDACRIVSGGAFERSDTVYLNHGRSMICIFLLSAAVMGTGVTQWMSIPVPSSRSKASAWRQVIIILGILPVAILVIAIGAAETAFLKLGPHPIATLIGATAFAIVLQRRTERNFLHMDF